MSAQEQLFMNSHQTMDALQAEMARSVYMHEGDRNMLVGAICLDAAVLFEGEPGIGKTTIAKAAAAAMGGKFGRIQGAPDLLPGDITGSETYDPKNSDFKFHEGPVFSNVLLVDEINRMAPRTQAGLLEAMQERQVTVGGRTYNLPRPFVVLATQNPDELGQGTNAVVQAGLDRFAMGIKLKALGASDRISIRNLNQNNYVTDQVIDIHGILGVKAAVEHMPDTPEMLGRTNRIIEALRALDKVDLRTSVLGGERPFSYIIDLAKTQAMLNGDRIVGDEHINTAAIYVLPHRTQVTYEAEDQGITPHELVREIAAAA